MSIPKYSHAHIHKSISSDRALSIPSFQERYAFVAVVTGLDVSADGRVMVTYGCADNESRALMLTVGGVLPQVYCHHVPDHLNTSLGVGMSQILELEQLFSGNITFRSTYVPYERVKEKPIS
jgi:hypothetical protein